MYKINILSLGCAKNLVDSEVMTGMLRKAGFEITGAQDVADIIIVNTCGFISDAKEEAIDALLEAAQQKKQGSCRAIVAAGCLAQRYSNEIMQEIPEIDGLIGTGEIPRIVEVVTAVAAGEKMICVAAAPSFIYDHNMPRELLTPHYTAYIKVAEGCNNRCAYCAIPQIRGEYRSRKLESITAEARALAEKGVREINLIAQDTTRYGLDIYGEYKLDELLQGISGIDGIEWIRILYAYPTHFTDSLIEVMASNDKICKYLDIPLQHADNNILRKMNRQGSSEDVLSLIEKLRRNIPGLALRTSLIVGFPGETEQEYQTLADFVKKVRFDHLGVFVFSPEDGTPAAEMPGQVSEEIKEYRKDRLMKIQQELSYARNIGKIGEIISVLIEGKVETEAELYEGRTQYDAPEVDGIVSVRGINLKPGDIVPVKITHAYEYDLIGEVIDEPAQ
ncbi:30S ribosomal protein S12 methylthiotransferase RimO [Phosphitispora fastidiosa]|uniref:30S ribosomal protein S12 methylthiotransferase RimO n=1 Tax=Phosphitispora fastidiosa TaxID=2837202 RepID=UPI001E59F24C|nr:ribosomal protein S12 methylthiotransferase [Phosphitispora fastidiosa]